MRETAEPADDIGVLFGIFLIFGIGRAAEQLVAAQLANLCRGMRAGES